MTIKIIIIIWLNFCFCSENVNVFCHLYGKLSYFINYKQNKHTNIQKLVYNLLFPPTLGTQFYWRGYKNKDAGCIWSQNQDNVERNVALRLLITPLVSSNSSSEPLKQIIKRSTQCLSRQTSMSSKIWNITKLVLIIWRKILLIQYNTIQ